MIHHAFVAPSALAICFFYLTSISAQEEKNTGTSTPAFPATGHQIISQDFEPGINAKLHRLLDQSVNLDYFDSKVADVLDDLRSQYQVQILLDESAVDNGLDVDSLITLKQNGATLRDALNKMTSSFDCTWALDDDVVLLLGKEEAYLHFELRVYDCRELLKADNRGAESIEKLKNVIRSSVEPWSWDLNGGKATVSDFGGMIIVLQRASFQEAIEKLLQEIKNRMAEQPAGH